MVGVEDVLSYFGGLCVIFCRFQMLIDPGLKSSTRSAYVFESTIITSDLIDTTFFNRRGFIQFIID
jgi:hypothetical protein